jgi:dCTP diphosphatase
MHDTEQAVTQFLNERGWDRLRPSDIAKSIIIEAAELLEVFQWNSLDLDEAKQDPAVMAKVEEELADVLIYALEMSTLLQLDTKQIILNKLERNAVKYPAGRLHQGATAKQ